MIKQLIAVMALAATAASASAQQVQILHNEYGSGTPGSNSAENAEWVANDFFHAPQYLPYHPTAGTIWPRVVEVNCVRIGTSVVATYNRNGDQVSSYAQPKLKCEGYNWTPKMGRAEYLFIKPRIVEPAPVEVRERIIIKEVERKKIRQ